MKPDVAVYVRRHFLGEDRAEHQASSRQSITEIIETYAADLPPHLIAVSINDEPPLEPIKFAGTDQEWSPWDCIRPKPGARVFIRLKAPEGEQGGVGHIAFQVGIVAAMVGVMFIPGIGPFAAAGIAAGIGIGGTFAMGALFKPPEPPGVEGEETSYSITGVRNQMARIGQVIPYVTKWGEHYPLHVAQPYVTTEGGEQYLHALLSPGWGPIRFSDLKIGDTPFASFPELEWATRNGESGETLPQLYKRAVFEAAPNVTVRKDAGPVTAVIDDDVTRLEIELTWPDGIWGMSESGQSKSQWCHVRIEYREVGVSLWELLADEVVSKNIRRTWRQRWGVDVAEGRYEARVTRLNDDVPEEDTDRYKNEFYWTSFLGRSGKPAIHKKGLALIAIRVKAGPNTQGILDRISCDVARWALDWNGSSWVEQLTENPASIYRDICQHSGANRGEIIPTSRLDLPGLQAWHQRCATAGRTFAGVFADQATILDRLRNVAAAGRASFTPIDTKLGVVEDIERIVPVQTITPHNSTGYAKVQQFRRLADAVRVSFMDRTNGWVRNEMIVYNDGFSATNAVTFDDLDLVEQGITRPARAHDEGRYYLAQQIHRPWVAQVEMDLEALAARRGEMVHFAHPAQLLGITTGRVAAVSTSGANVIGVTLESDVLMETGKLYSIRLRTVSTAGAHQAIEIAVNTQVGRQTQLTFSAPITQSTLNAQRGDMYVYGARGFVGVDCVVRSLSPSGPRTVVVELVPHAQPEINDAQTGAIGDYDPRITPPQGRPKPPPKPVLLKVRRDEIIPAREPIGITKVQLVAVLAAPPARSTAATTHQVRYREEGETDWAGVTAETTGLEVSFIVPFGFIYEVQVQAMAFHEGLALSSAWSASAVVNAKKIGKTIIDVASVTGLELRGQAHNRQFVGRDAHLVWRMTSSSGGSELTDEEGGGDNTFRDPTFSHWRVSIFTGGPDNTELRREDAVTQPEYLYNYDKNYADAELLSPGNPVAKVARRFTVEVRIVDTYGRASAVPARLTVSNPAPALPLGLSVSTNIGTIWVSFTLPTDPDWIGMKVWASTISGFSPGPANLLGKTATNIASFNEFAHNGSPVLQGTDYFIRIAAFDAFGDEAQVLNVSGEFAVQTATVDLTDLPQFVFDPAPNYIVTIGGGTNGADRLSWTPSTAKVTHPVSGTTNTYNIGTSAISYSGLTRYIYYKIGDTLLSTSTDPAAFVDTDETLMAVWRGGNDVAAFNGQAGIDGAFIYGQTITANAIATGVAVITQSAQIAAAIINNAHITNLSADKILAGSVFTQVVHVGNAAGARITIDGNDLEPGVRGGLIEVRDAALVRRVRIGHIGTTGGEWGLEIRDSNGALVFRADGMNGVFIDPESISGLKLEIDAVSRHATTLTGAQITLDAGGNPDSVATAVVTTLPQARTLVWFAADCPGGIAAGATDWQCALSLYRNNTLLKSRTVTGPSAALIWYTFDDNPESGTNSYEIRGDMSDQQSVQNLVVRQRQLSVLSLIR